MSMPTENESDLVTRIRARSDADGLPLNHELRQAATALETELQRKICSPMRLVGIWARTRRLWCTYSGEELV